VLFKTKYLWEDSTDLLEVGYSISMVACIRGVSLVMSVELLSQRISTREFPEPYAVEPAGLLFLSLPQFEISLTSTT
jgi:hypothetical protein